MSWNGPSPMTWQYAWPMSKPYPIYGTNVQETWRKQQAASAYETSTYHNNPNMIHTPMTPQVDPMPYNVCAFTPTMPSPWVPTAVPYFTNSCYAPTSYPEMIMAPQNPTTQPIIHRTISRRRRHKNKSRRRRPRTKQGDKKATKRKKAKHSLLDGDQRNTWGKATTTKPKATRSRDRRLDGRVSRLIDTRRGYTAKNRHARINTNLRDMLASCDPDGIGNLRID